MVLFAAATFLAAFTSFLCAAFTHSAIALTRFLTHDNSHDVQFYRTLSADWQHNPCLMNSFSLLASQHHDPFLGNIFKCLDTLDIYAATIGHIAFCGTSHSQSLHTKESLLTSPSAIEGPPVLVGPMHS